MKIVIVTPEFYPINGGISNSSQNFAELLNRYDFDVHAVTPLVRNFEKFEIHNHTMIKRIKPFFGFDPYKTIGKFLFAFQAAIYIRSLKPDVVIGESTSIIGGFVSGLVNNKRIKTFIRARGSALHSHFINNNSFKKIFFKLMVNLNDLALVHTTTQYLMLSKMINNIKIEYLLNYMPVNSKKKIFDSNSPLKLLSVSRLIEIKGIQYCLLALADINIDYEYTIVGDGEYRSELEKIIKEKNIKNVKFMGNIPYHKVKDFMERSDLMVSLSTREGLSNTMLEAFASGLPILASDVGGPKNFIKHNISGYKVQPKSVEDVINALNYISINRDILAKYSKNSRKIVEKYFGEKAIINHLKKLILSV